MAMLSRSKGSSAHALRGTLFPGLENHDARGPYRPDVIATGPRLDRLLRRSRDTFSNLARPLGDHVDGMDLADLAVVLGGAGGGERGLVPRMTGEVRPVHARPRAGGGQRG